MRAVLAIVCVTTGCSTFFGLDSPTQRDADLDDTRPADTAADARLLNACPKMASGADSLVACFDFEYEAVDQMGNLPASATNLLFVQGKLGAAARFGFGSAITIPDTPLLDLSAVTMQAWIRPALLGAERMGIWDTDQQYAVFVLPTGAVRCQNDCETPPGVLTMNRWTHVACTVDASGTQLYVDGIRHCQTATPIFMTGTMGAAIGANAPSGDTFMGEIDLVRLHKTVRTAAEICEDAGC